MPVNAKRLLEIPDERHPIMTATTINELERAWSIGCTDKQACIQAGISEAALYHYQRDNRDFEPRKEKLKQNLILVSKRTIYKQAKKDAKTAAWYLERKLPEEFGQKIEINQHVTLSIEQIDQRIEALQSSNPALLEMIQDADYTDDSELTE